jgi:hypothetical protein
VYAQRANFWIFLGGPKSKFHSASLGVPPPRQATSRIRKDVASLAAQAAELHATVSSAQALGIGGGGGSKSVADIEEMTKETQALTKKVEKLKAQTKSQVPVALTRSRRERAPLLIALLLFCFPSGNGFLGARHAVRQGTRVQI